MDSEKAFGKPAAPIKPLTPALLRQLRVIATSGLAAVEGLRALSAPINQDLHDALVHLQESTEEFLEEDIGRAFKEHEEMRAKLQAAYDCLEGWADSLEERARDMRGELPDELRSAIRRRRG